uniref:Small nuclear ribonucleoprotein Sm D3 n=1 Tax=Solanum chacoense TaxID=4108 RepID=A0A0V0HPI8_SOLCH
MSRSLGIPVKLLHEATGHIVTVEMKSGELYRGSMVECEDNWNCQLESITYTAKDGRVSQLEHVFIRGSKVRFMIIPDMLKNAPMFKRLESRIKGKVHHSVLDGDVLWPCELKLRLQVVE